MNEKKREHHSSEAELTTEDGRASCRVRLSIGPSGGAALTIVELKPDPSQAGWNVEYRGAVIYDFAGR